PARGRARGALAGARGPEPRPPQPSPSPAAAAASSPRLLLRRRRRRRRCLPRRAPPGWPGLRPGMAERESGLGGGAASPPAASPFLGLHIASPPNFRSWTRV
ncbi:hypothetical protein U0070_002174, partial [Myodes glareolus]